MVLRGAFFFSWQFFFKVNVNEHLLESTKKGLLVAVDTIGCGEGNIVIVAGGGAARLIGGCQNAPIDLAVIGIVDHQIQQI